MKTILIKSFCYVITLLCILLTLYCFDSASSLPDVTDLTTNSSLSSSSIPTNNGNLKIDTTDEKYPINPVEWTYMLYISADNNICRYVEEDFIELSSVFDYYNGKCYILVLFDANPTYCNSFGSDGNTKLYRISDTLTLKLLEVPGWINKNGSELNMGDPDTLTKFINFCVSNYPAQKYHLTMWSHGDGWLKSSFNQNDKDTWKATSYDSTDSDKLYTREIQTALTNSGFSSTHKLDILTLDACLMGMVEVAHQLRNHVQYFGASPMEIPITGYYYEEQLKRFFSREASARTALQFVIDTADTFVELPHSNTYVVCDTSFVHNVATAVNSWTLSLGLDVTSRRSELMNATNNTNFEPYHSIVPYYDLYELTYFTSNTNSTEAQAVRSSINDLVVHYNLSPTNENKRSLSVVCGEEFIQWYTNDEYNPINIDWALPGEAGNYAEVISGW